MANTITAGNGTNNGLAVASDATGALNILTGSGAGTAAISIDSSQNVTMAADAAVTGDLAVTGNTTITGTLSATGGVTGSLASATAQASTSGTSIDFTSIPAGVKRITVMFNGVSTSGTSIILIQLGDSGGVETTGYSGSTQYAASYVAFSSYAGIPIDTASTVAAGTVRSGVLILSLLDTATNTWAMNGGFALGTAAALILPAGIKATSATLDRVRITTVNGTDTFDAGTINLIYE